MKIIQGLNKVAKGMTKHSPLILTIGGVVGLGATAVLSYKARSKVEVIVDNLEAKREEEARIEELQTTLNTMASADITDSDMVSELAVLEQDFVPLSKAEVVKDLAGAVALPVVTGVASLACITLSWYIMNNRLLTVSGALATATAEHVYYKRRVADRYGDEVAEELSTPVRNEKRMVRNENTGKEKEQEVSVREELQSLEGEWFDQSCEYTADDHSYNVHFVNAVKDKLENQFTRNGSLLLNQVYDALGLPRTKTGALMGWSGAGFAITPATVKTLNEDTGFLEPQLYVKWTRPSYIYDQMNMDALIPGVI